MELGKIGLKAVKMLFRNPSREGAKLYEQVPMGLSLAFTGYGIYDTIKNIKANNESKVDEGMINTYAGMAATFGSIFGVGGAILLGGGVKLLGENVKQNFA